MDWKSREQRLDALSCTHLKELYRLGSAIATQGEDGLLLCLYAENRPMLSGELVERMGLTTGRIANILRMLEAKGLVDRAQDTNDRRKVHITLTAPGRARAEAQHHARAESYRRLLDYLGDEDSESFLRLLERCLEYYAEEKA